MSGKPGRPVTVFLSHALPKDTTWVRRLADALHERGFESWLDAGTFCPGEDWLNQLRTRIESSDAVVVVLGERDRPSEAQLIELGAGMAAGRPAIVVARDIRGAADELRLRHVIEAARPEDTAERIAEIVTRAEPARDTLGA